MEKVQSPILNHKVLTSLLGSTIILDHFLTYLNYLRSSNGNLSGFWMTYIDLEDGHKWTKDGDMLTIEWMKGLPSPDVVLEFLSCKCSKECKAPTCPCITNGLKCTEACRLSDCSNFSAQDLQYAQDDESDYDSDA